ncbi:MAG: SMP-30/gluconolactonase/LRE family protein [Chloroflexi bacterium]|nr:SMP-30/gluconolactonase/LRE family protein [Chloroflexota bacterium]
MDVELIADYACRTGESPLWHPDERCVYWLDVPRGRIYRYDPASGAHGLAYENAQEIVGGYTIQADGALALMLPRGAVKAWRQGEMRTLIAEIPAERDTRLKDCLADPRGRVYVGTVSTPQKPGRLYRLDPDGSSHLLLTDIRGSNGLGLTPDRTGLYYTDSATGTIYLFDYDEDTGQIANQRAWVVVPPEEGVPDGMTVDAEGNVWSARWGGGCVVAYAPDGRELMRVEFPAKKVSCCIFGGHDYGDLYVTTAGGQNKEEEGPGAGALFRVRPGVRGLPEYRSRIGLDT